jgi:hypothetical protein
LLALLAVGVPMSLPAGARASIPTGRHVTSRTVVSHHNTLSERIFTRGSARVVGDLAN